ncbi:DNA replication/repair protein RecF [Roseomonas sp. CCTCC AB2023176]|uniref:DNA replication/repair protein RecF n=1 Tax=Roseomonas sp. CCTCC AB2023176 TaxID=3342640 RepID=UPI0035E1EB93
MIPSLRLTRLLLQDFRNHARAELRLEAGVVVIAGENGSGKTNLLEAISLLGPGRGLRGAKLAEFGRIGPEGPHPWAVSGRFEGPVGTFDLGTGTTADGGDKRSFRLDGNPVQTQAELGALVAAVWLTPQMDRLFTEAASGRRAFLDRLVWALDPYHAREVAAYGTAMTQRNRLLGDNRGDRAWLDGLEDAMARHGVALTAARRALIARLNAVLAGGVAGAFPAALAALDCSTAAALQARSALEVEDGLRETLAANRGRDAGAGMAVEGPHRCDLRLSHLPKGVPAELCSTGEQKALLISTVLAHAALIAGTRGFAPLLLLDEIAAHLDARRRDALFEALAALPAQSFLTGTEPGTFAPLRGIAQGFSVSPGGVVPDPAFPVPLAA